jgi:hypothetical protein
MGSERPRVLRHCHLPYCPTHTVILVRGEPCARGGWSPCRSRGSPGREELAACPGTCPGPRRVQSANEESLHARKDRRVQSTNFVSPKSPHTGAPHERPDAHSHAINASLRGSHRGAPSGPRVHRVANDVPRVTVRASVKILHTTIFSSANVAGQVRFTKKTKFHRSSRPLSAEDSSGSEPERSPATEIQGTMARPSRSARGNRGGGLLEVRTRLWACGEEAAAESNWEALRRTGAHMTPPCVPRLLCQDKDPAATPAPSITPNEESRPTIS